MRSPGEYIPGGRASVSATLSWDECPAAFWFDRVLHVPSKDRAYYILGGELHKVQEWLLTLKRSQQPLATEAEVTEQIQKDLAEHLAAPETVIFADKETPEILTEDAIEMARVWMREVLPRIEPFGLEVRVGPEDGLVLPTSGTPVTAYLDVVDQDGYIVDLKTSKRKWSEDEEDTQRRLSTIVYAWAFRIKFGSPPAAFRYDVLVRKARGKTRPQAETEYQPIKVVPDLRLEAGALRRMEAIVAQMKAGQYYPVKARHCDDCSFAEFCTAHFQSAPPAPWCELGAPAPADGPRYLQGGGDAGRAPADRRSARGRRRRATCGTLPNGEEAG